jgi:hypothetical protein
VFLKCARCERRCTRLYLPLATSSLACRRCWGLSYTSQQRYNYKDGLWGRGVLALMLGITQREWALGLTDERRSERRQLACERCAMRRGHLRARH